MKAPVECTLALAIGVAATPLEGVQRAAVKGYVRRRWRGEAGARETGLRCRLPGVGRKDAEELAEELGAELGVLRLVLFEVSGRRTVCVLALEPNYNRAANNV